MRLKQLIAKFLSWCEKKRKPKTTKGYKLLLNRFLKHVGNKQLNRLLPIHLELWAKTWHEVQAVQRLFQWAKDSLCVVRKNVFASVPKPAVGMRRRIMTPREMAAYLRKTKNCFRDFLIGLRETWARPGEIRHADWELLQSEDPRIPIEEALAAGRALFVMTDYKSRERRSNPNEPRVILVNRRLGRLIMRLRQRRIADGKELSGAVFRNIKDARWTYNAVRCRMRRLRRKFQLPADIHRENIVAYSFRHTSGTLAIAAGGNIKIVGDIMGHTSVETTKRYVHLQVGDLRKEMAKIEDADGKAAAREQRLKDQKRAA